MSDQALAVDLQLAGPHAGKVRDWVESVLGWQPVDGGEGGLAAVVTLTDVPAEPTTSLPTIVLVAEDDDAVGVARRVLSTDAAAVLVWPAERGELPMAAERVTAGQAVAPDAPAMRVGGASGGVGTTTVALALGGLAAWSGVRTLVLGSGHVPVRDVARVDAAVITAHGIWGHATQVPGIPRLRALAVEGSIQQVPRASDAALVVVDAGVDPEVDVLVGRRDAATLRALEVTCAGVLVLGDDGSAPVASLHAALGRRRLVAAPRSRRVAAAGLSGRVPSAVPGAWLAGLRPIVAGLERQY